MKEIKRRLGDVAKDLGMTNKDLAALLKEGSNSDKKYLAASALGEKEMDIIVSYDSIIGNFRFCILWRRREYPLVTGRKRRQRKRLEYGHSRHFDNRKRLARNVRRSETSACRAPRGYNGDYRLQKFQRGGVVGRR